MDTECDVDRSAGRGFNLSALYALLMLVATEIYRKTQPLVGFVILDAHWWNFSESISIFANCCYIFAYSIDENVCRYLPLFVAPLEVEHSDK